ncbi:MAG TPA: S46 family peptidase [candidate division Zixibacteria bacterium]|nr:S46 family peptidase [candidate division Zixibacteria bacterium]MDD4916971.1 S46 family peptidase [candidate division Zixibacteria bacterium]MDM7974169.1 S46 family peptidase [candidate division Zixibacteria bacterium]HOD67591.1 S46 family peptidase [candidate division Zixibacteria bacterium]HOZ06781.1 S46 family peptidase [candidate division Zixibacteria bacterium]
MRLRFHTRLGAGDYLKFRGVRFGRRGGARSLMTAVAIAAALSGGAAADEGMWPLYELDRLDWDSLQARGLRLSREQMYDTARPDVADACINLGGGSASFVSPKGLIITNHHVAFGAIQRASTVEHNYLRDGFYAPTPAEEIRAVGTSVYVTLAEADVSDRVLAAVPEELDGLARYEALDRITKEIVREAEQGRDDIQAEVTPIYGGTKYTLTTFLRIRDVRIVHAPPMAIGNYGDEIDNWIWPRHVGDYSFLRAYVGPDGKPAEYSRDNVPYEPQAWLPVSAQGVKEGDFTMMIGYPGKTQRYTVARAIAEAVNFTYPRSIDRSLQLLAKIDSAGAENPGIALRMASTVQGISNRMKKTQGLVAGLARDSVVARTAAAEAELTVFLRGDSARWERFGGLIPAFDSLYDAHAAARERREVLGMVWYVDHLSLARQVYRWAEQREKPDPERESGYQDRDSLRVLRRLEQAQINLVPAMDRVFMRYWLEQALALPDGQRLAAVDSLFAGGPERDRFLDRLLDRMFAQTKVGQEQARREMFRMSTADLRRLRDPFIDLAAALGPEFERMQTEERVFASAAGRLERQYMRALQAWKGDRLYPDANGTKRFSFGEVRRYSPRDAVTHDYITSLTGVMEKETGAEPFIVPAELKQVWRRRDFWPYVDAHLNDVPVDFITTNDGTNGNSGSPVLNGRGELIGLDFDTNIESVHKDFCYNRNLSRAVVADVRYILFLLDKVYGYRALLDELTVR